MKKIIVMASLLLYFTNLSFARVIDKIKIFTLNWNSIFNKEVKAKSIEQWTEKQNKNPCFKIRNIKLNEELLIIHYND